MFYGCLPLPSWTDRKHWIPSRTIGGVSLLLTLSQAMVLLVHFNQLTPATPLWPLKLTYISLTVRHLPSQKPRLIGKVFSSPSLLLIIHKHSMKTLMVSTCSLMSIGTVPYNQLND